MVRFGLACECVLFMLAYRECRCFGDVVVVLFIEMRVPTKHC